MATLAVVVFAAASAEADDFEIKSAAPLAVMFRGAPLIVGEDVAPAFAANPAVSRVTVPGWDTVFHVWRADEASKTRVEVAASSDAFEFTLVRLVQADVAGFVRYGFVVPHEFLDGRQAEVVGTGEKMPAEYVQRGQIVGPLGANAISAVRPIAYLRVQHPSGALDFDFNPRGVWTGDSTVTPHAAEWAMRRDKDGYVFTTAFSRTIWGTVQEFKFVIRRADPRPVKDVHPRVSTRWTSPYPNALQVRFNPTPVAGDGSQTPARWRDPASVRAQRDERFRDSAPTRYEGACPANPRTGAALEVNVGRDGYYLVNMLVGAPDRAIGPCEARVNGKPSAALPSVAAGVYDSWAVVGLAERGVLTLHLRGDFRLTALSLAPMLYENEDFLFRRGWWLSTQRHPDDTLPD